MKSRISFYNKGVARLYLKRFWPLWAGYFVVLLLMLPGAVSSWMRSSLPYRTGDTPDLAVLRSGVGVVYLSMLVGVLAAMAVFHYLYQSRSCGMMNALPIRRETMFSTAWLTGLLPLLAADVLVCAVTALLLLPGGQVTVSALGKWLLLAVLSNLVFYGFAVFCAVLTGSLLVLPLVYAVLGLTAAVAETCVRDILTYVVYGFGTRGLSLSFLSPPVALLGRLSVQNAYEWLGTSRRAIPGVYELRGLGLLAIYAAVGLGLSLAALLLYRRRRMETATDVVAIPILKPVFKYCLSVGCALVFTDVIYAWFFGGGSLSGWFYHAGQGGVSGHAGALVVLILLLLGAFLGYFAAEMLIQKTLRVFHGKWKGLVIVWAALALLLGCSEFDLPGYERRVPEPGEVESVTLNMTGELRESGSIAAVLDYHHRLLFERDTCESAPSNYTLLVTYALSDGKLLQRNYRVPVPADGESLQGTLLGGMEALYNMPEAILGRTTPQIPVTRENILQGSLYVNYVDELGRWRGEDVFLTPAEAVELYEQGILPDARAGRINYNWYGEGSVYYDRLTNCTIEIELRLPGEKPEGDPYGMGAWDMVYVQVSTDAENTLRWLRQHTEVEITTQRQLQELAEALG